MSRFWSGRRTRVKITENLRGRKIAEALRQHHLHNPSAAGIRYVKCHPVSDAGDSAFQVRVYVKEDSHGDSENTSKRLGPCSGEPLSCKPPTFCTADDFSLMFEIASLPMSNESFRVVAASMGNKQKAASIMGLEITR